MTFAYYKRLSPTDKKIYNQSDAIDRLHLPAPDRFAEGLIRLESALASGNHEKTQSLTQWLVRSLHNIFRVPHVEVKVLAKRPSDDWGELHGLYESRSAGGKSARITVWMRTAKRRDVVAFKTFLHTVIHEVMHHIDFTYLKLADSFHTEGFYKREAALTRELLQAMKQIKVSASQ